MSYAMLRADLQTADPEEPSSMNGPETIILDRSGRLSERSHEAAALAARLETLDAPIRVIGQRLIAAEWRDQTKLDRLVRAAADGAHLEIMLDSEAGGAFLLQAAPTGLFLRLRLWRIARSEGLSQRFADLFELTPTEARLAEALMSGAGVVECAERFGVSQATVRTQLAAIFDKTGCRRQTSLIALLASVAAIPRP